MNHKKQLRLKKTYLKEIETSELDFILEDDIFGKGHHDDDSFSRERDIKNNIKNKSWTEESNPISIKLLRSFIEKIEKTGANYLEIMHHGDHHSYVFNAVKIERASIEECEKETGKETLGKKIKGRMKELEIKHNKLSTELKKIEQL